MKESTRKSARRRKHLYTTGELNRFIDAVCHPLAKIDPSFLLLDGLLHGVVERNPPESVMKFIHHNLPTLLEEYSHRAKMARERSRQSDFS